MFRGITPARRRLRMESLSELARMIHARNAIDHVISMIIGRPAEKGHVAEYIASKVFDIALERSATNKGHDGRFIDGELAGKTVNVKYYGKREGILDINPAGIPDFYLVLAGPPAAPQSSRGTERPWLIEGVYLFRGPDTILGMRRRGVRIGVASSVPMTEWDAAQIYPVSKQPLMVLSGEQRQLLSLFGGTAAERLLERKSCGEALP